MILKKHEMQGTTAYPAVAFAALLFFTFPATSRAGESRIILNQAAILYAEELIEDRRFTADQRNAWREHHPSADQEIEFVRAHGFGEYAKWYLVLDQSHAPDTKARYKFPCGDFKIIHRCALLAVKSRARQFGYAEVENAAARLLELLAAQNDSTQPTR